MELEPCSHGVQGFTDEPVNSSCVDCLTESATIVNSCLVTVEGSNIVWVPLDRLSRWEVQDHPQEAGPILKVMSSRGVYNVPGNPYDLARQLSEALE
jgi:hypothetical protein